MLSPALTGIEFEVDFADLWQAMSEVPKFAGSMKPEGHQLGTMDVELIRLPLSWFNASQPAVATTWLAGR